MPFWKKRQRSVSENLEQSGSNFLRTDLVAGDFAVTDDGFLVICERDRLPIDKVAQVAVVGDTLLVGLKFESNDAAAGLALEQQGILDGVLSAREADGGDHHPFEIGLLYAFQDHRHADRVTALLTQHRIGLRSS